MSKSHDATFYVQVEPVWSRWTNSQGEKNLDSIKAVGITQTRPSKPRSGVIIAKLTLRIPDGAFLPLRPEAVIVVPDEMTVVSPLQVTVEDPS